MTDRVDDSPGTGFDLARMPEWAWRELLDRVARGDHPQRPELAELVAKHGTPTPEAREYVAACLRDDTRLRYGRPTVAPRLRAWQTVYLAVEVERLRAAFALQGVNSPKRKALAIVARTAGKAGRPIAAETLKGYISDDLRDFPHLRRGVADFKATAKAAVKREVDEGLATLDPKLGLRRNE